MPCPYVSQVLDTCKFPVVKIVGNIDVIQCFPTDYMARNMLFFIVSNDCCIQLCLTCAGIVYACVREWRDRPYIHVNNEFVS